MAWERGWRRAIIQKQLTVTCNYASVQREASRDSAGGDGEPSREFCFPKLPSSNGKKMAKHVFCCLSVQPNGFLHLASGPKTKRE